MLELVDAEVTVVPTLARPARDPPEGRIGVAVRGVRLTYAGGPEMLQRSRPSTVPAGERLALVGQTGSGKTTLARLIVAVHGPFRG